MRTTGTVRAWHDDEGWGIVDSVDTPGGCWAHFSSLVGRGALRPGEEVELVYEATHQDGYRFRAVEVTPADGGDGWRHIEGTGPSAAYESTLSLSFDEPDQPDGPRS